MTLPILATKTVSPARLPNYRLVEICLALICVLLVSSIFLALWCPDANEMDKRAWKLHEEFPKGNNIQEELWLRAALLWREVFLGPDDPDVTHGLEYLAFYYYRSQQKKLSEDLLARAISIHELNLKRGSTDRNYLNIAHVDFINVLRNSIAIYIEQNRFHDAARLLKRESELMQNATRTPVEFIDIYQKQAKLVRPHVEPGEMPPRNLHIRSKSWSMSLQKSINTLRLVKDQSAESLGRRSLRNRLQGYALISTYEMQQGNYATAEKQLMEAVELSKKNDDACHTMIQHTLDLATLFKTQQNFALSEHWCKELLTDSSCIKKSSPLQKVMIRRFYADLLRSHGKNEEATNLENQALEIIRQEKIGTDEYNPTTFVSKTDPVARNDLNPASY